MRGRGLREEREAATVVGLIINHDREGLRCSVA